jgi:hypothetical protein
VFPSHEATISQNASYKGKVLRQRPLLLHKSKIFEILQCVGYRVFKICVHCKIIKLWNTSLLVPGGPSRLGIAIYIVTLETPRPVGARHTENIETDLTEIEEPFLDWILVVKGGTSGVLL